MQGFDDLDGRPEGASSVERDFEGILAKMKNIQESLATIEDWMEGEQPDGLALAIGPSDFSELRRAPLTIDTVGDVIDHEHR